MNTNKETNPVLRSRLRERFFIFIVNNFSAGFLNMETKVCSKCKIPKELSEFGIKTNQKDRLNLVCKECQRIYSKNWRNKNRDKVRKAQKDWKKRNHERIKETNNKYAREQYAKNPEKYIAIQKKYREKNKEKVKERFRKWYNNNKEKSDLATRKWQKNNADKIRKYRNNRYKNDIAYRLNANIRIAVSKSLKGNKNGHKWESIVGYTQKDLFNHLQKTMPKGYTWNDYLKGDLHVDHRIPLAIYNITGVKSKGFKEAWKLGNLRLLPKKENQEKNKKLFY